MSGLSDHPLAVGVRLTDLGLNTTGGNVTGDDDPADGNDTTDGGEEPVEPDSDDGTDSDGIEDSGGLMRM